MQNIVYTSTGCYDRSTQSAITTNTINDKCTQGPKVESKHKACTASRKKNVTVVVTCRPTCS